MRSSGAHVALVVGHKGPEGVVFLEDIIEELVGEVRDMIARSQPS
jgi:CBS domain containing-hemolysin-like protein